MMKHEALCIFTLLIASCLCACSVHVDLPHEVTNAPSEPELHMESEAQSYLSENYSNGFTLWCPDGHDLYAFYVYPDHAERKCDILMPENMDDISEYHKNLSWQTVGDELIFTGDWEETLKVDASAGTAVSVSTGKEYRICEPKIQLSDNEDLPLAVKVNGKIYYSNGERSTVTARCGNMDGQITASVSSTEIPTEDNQSNFGTGYGYQYGSNENTVEIYMKDSWWVFQTVGTE